MGRRETREGRDSENFPYAGQHPIKDFQGTFQGSLDQLLSVGSGADLKERIESGISMSSNFVGFLHLMCKYFSKC